MGFQLNIPAPSNTPRVAQKIHIDLIMKCSRIDKEQCWFQNKDDMPRLINLETIIDVPQEDGARN